jgi:hypothetical protein
MMAARRSRCPPAGLVRLSPPLTFSFSLPSLRVSVSAPAFPPGKGEGAALAGLSPRGAESAPARLGGETVRESPGARLLLLGLTLLPTCSGQGPLVLPSRPVLPELCLPLAS